MWKGNNHWGIVSSWWSVIYGSFLLLWFCLRISGWTNAWSLTDFGKLPMEDTGWRSSYRSDLQWGKWLVDTDVDNLIWGPPSHRIEEDNQFFFFFFWCIPCMYPAQWHLFLMRILYSMTLQRIYAAQKIPCDVTSCYLLQSFPQLPEPISLTAQ